MNKKLIEHQLTNRKTGHKHENIAKQFVLSMASKDPDYNPNDGANEFLGFHAAEDTLFLLTHNSIYAAEMPK